MTALQDYEAFLNSPVSPLAVGGTDDPQPFEERIIGQAIETKAEAVAVLTDALAWLEADHDDELHQRGRASIERVARFLGAEALPATKRTYCGV